MFLGQRACLVELGLCWLVRAPCMMTLVDCWACLGQDMPPLGVHFASLVYSMLGMLCASWISYHLWSLLSIQWDYGGILNYSRRAFNCLLGESVISAAWGCVGCSGHLAWWCLFIAQNSFAWCFSFNAQDLCFGDLSVAQRAFCHLLGHTLIHIAWGYFGCSRHFHDGAYALLSIAFVSLFIYCSCFLFGWPVGCAARLRSSSCVHGDLYSMRILCFLGAFCIMLCILSWG